MLKIWEYINNTLLEFEKCFTRQRAFRWFIVIVVGFMVRTDFLGVTSIFRVFGIDPRYYNCALHFFHSNSWTLSSIRDVWIKIVARFDGLYRVNGMPILIGDGVKQSKEARKMPAVKKLCQESENSSKPSYIFGHLFGALGFLVGGSQKLFCVPVSMTIQDGNEVVGNWNNDKLANESHVERMIHEASDIANTIDEKCLLLLDRYFLSVPALKMWNNEEKRTNKKLLTLITRAKTSAKAFEKPEKSSGRGRPRIKGEDVKLMKLFTTEADSFLKVKVTMYGKQKEVKYLCKDLLWGKKLYTELRFVLVEYGDDKAILVSTDTTLSPEKIIELYCLRFKCESCFREFKQVLSGFGYHFWSKFMTKLNRYTKASDAQKSLEEITDEKVKTNIVLTFKAIEGFVMFNCVAMGIIQMSAIKFPKEIYASPFRWLRTRTCEIPSEATTADFLRKTIFCAFNFLPNLSIRNFILLLQSDEFYKIDDDVA